MLVGKSRSGFVSAMYLCAILASLLALISIASADNRLFMPSGDKTPTKLFKKLIKTFVTDDTAVRTNYQNIEDYLVSQVKSDDIDANLDAAEKWVTSLRYAKRKQPGLVEALDKLIGLRYLVENARCTQEELEQLKVNDSATGYKRDASNLRFRRVDKIFRHFAVDHAYYCITSVYVHGLKPKYSSLNKSMEDVVVKITRMVFERYWGESEAKTSKAREILDPTQLALDSNESAKEFLSLLNYLSKDDPDSVYLSVIESPTSSERMVRGDKIKELFTNYLVNPCVYFSSQLSPFLRNLGFSFKLWEEFDFEPTAEVEQMIITYNRWRVCEKLVKVEKDSLLDKLIEIIKLNQN